MNFSFPLRRCSVQRGIFKKLTDEDKFIEIMHVG